MSKRGTRYVYDSGAIFRLTEKQYRAYVFRNSHSLNPVSQYGTLVGHAAFNATRAGVDDFADEAKQLRAGDKLAASVIAGKP